MIFETSHRGTTHLGTPLFNVRSNFVTNLTRTFQPLLVIASQRRRIMEIPMESSGDARKDWATFGTCFIANGDHIREQIADLNTSNTDRVVLLRLSIPTSRIAATANGLS
jgi:hypothetical protein